MTGKKSTKASEPPDYYLYVLKRGARDMFDIGPLTLSEAIGRASELFTTALEDTGDVDGMEIVVRKGPRS